MRYSVWINLLAAYSCLLKLVVSDLKSYDYIIVGGGTSGCALAATLSTRSKVLLLERGGSPYENTNLTRREGFLLSLSDVGENRPLQAFVSTDGVRALRARVLGGGTSVNAGIYSRASEEEISRMGLDPVLAESSYEWVESVIPIPSLLPPDTYQAILRSSMLKAGIKPDNGATYKHFIGTKTTGTLFDSQGYRHPSSNLLKFANTSNMQVLLNAMVQRVLFTGTTAIGVEYTNSTGRTHTAMLNCKRKSHVILSAGALGSPQLLMLSGIGPKNHLKAMNVPIVLDSPYVGRYMADNPAVLIIVPSPTPVATSRGQVLGITGNGSYISGGSRPGGGGVISEVSGPLSRGRLQLKTLNVSDNPEVTFNYFKSPGDLRKCVAGLNVLEKMVLSTSFAAYRFNNQTFPSGRTSTSSNATAQPTIFAKYCMANKTTAYHFHGGCLVGKVLGFKYGVLGIERLRVVDGSTMQFSAGTNPCATLMMLGRYMGLLMLQEQE